MRPITSSIKCLANWLSSSRRKCSTPQIMIHASARSASPMLPAECKVLRSYASSKAVSTSISSLRSSEWRTWWSNSAKSSTNISDTAKKATWVAFFMAALPHQEKTTLQPRPRSGTYRWCSWTRISSFSRSRRRCKCERSRAWPFSWSVTHVASSTSWTCFDLLKQGGSKQVKPMWIIETKKKRDVKWVYLAIENWVKFDYWHAKL